MNDQESRRAEAEIRRLVDRDLEAGLRRFREREPAIRFGSVANASFGKSHSLAGRWILAAGLAVLAVIAGSMWLLRSGRAPVGPPSSIAAALADLPGVRAIAGPGSELFTEGRASGAAIAPGLLGEIFGRFAASAPRSLEGADLARLEETPRLGLEMMFKILYQDRAVERALRRFGRQG